MLTLNPLTDTFWASFGNDIPIWIAGILPLWYRSHKCHVKGCHRLGHYQFQHYKLCKKHHPAVPVDGVTHLHITKLHKETTK